MYNTIFWLNKRRCCQLTSMVVEMWSTSYQHIHNTSGITWLTYLFFKYYKYIRWESVSVKIYILQMCEGVYHIVWMETTLPKVWKLYLGELYFSRLCCSVAAVSITTRSTSRLCVYNWLQSLMYGALKMRPILQYKLLIRYLYKRFNVKKVL